MLPSHQTTLKLAPLNDRGDSSPRPNDVLMLAAVSEEFCALTIGKFKVLKAKLGALEGRLASFESREETLG